MRTEAVLRKVLKALSVPLDHGGSPGGAHAGMPGMLTPEQARVLELYRQMFVRSGAALEGAAAERLTAVKARLAVLGTQFGQNLLKITKDIAIFVDSKEQLAGMSDAETCSRSEFITGEYIYRYIAKTD